MEPPYSVEESKKLKSLAENNYFKVLTDFFKWTLPITLAAFAWVGSNLPTVTNAAKLSYLRLAVIFFAMSIIMSIIIIAYLLKYWKNDWEIRNQQIYFAKVYPITYLATDETVANIRDDYAKFHGKFYNWENTNEYLPNFQFGTIIYIIFLFGGLILYLTSLMVN